MKSGSTLLLLFVAVLLFCCCELSYAGTILVGSAGTYPTIQSGYSAAGNGDTILIQAGTYAGNDNFNNNISVALIGGYDSSFSTNSSYSVITGTLTVTSGTATVENIIIQSTTTTTTSTSTTSSTTSISTSTSTTSSTIPTTSVLTTISTTSTTTTSTSSSTTTIGNGTANVLSFTVNGSTCDSTLNAGYINDPCVNVTVCTPGTSTCVTINSILLDTGSYGLRIFKQTLGNVSLTPVASGSGLLAECVAYVDGSSDWGPVQMASVVLGNEAAVNVPIQVINSTFPTATAANSVCPGSDTQPSDAHALFNGILGVGPFVQDCGTGCVSSDNSGGNPTYYSCTGSTCTGTTVPLNHQVQNPVASLPTDNTGLIVEFPASPPSGGAASLTGSIVFGIGTQSNNVPSGVITYPLNPSDNNFTTIFNGVTYVDASFIDTGSNALYFPTPTSGTYKGELPNCKGADSGFFCPPTTKSNPDGITSFSASIEGSSGSPTGTVQFQIGNTDSLTNSSNNVFSDIGGSAVGYFDWGLPFYFGKNVFIGFEGMTSSLGTGPYFAY